jgi:hypothetical protein
MHTGLKENHIGLPQSMYDGVKTSDLVNSNPFLKNKGKKTIKAEIVILIKGVLEIEDMNIIVIAQ